MGYLHYIVVNRRDVYSLSTGNYKPLNNGLVTVSWNNHN